MSLMVDQPFGSELLYEEKEKGLVECNRPRESVGCKKVKWLFSLQDLLGYLIHNCALWLTEKEYRLQHFPNSFVYEKVLIYFLFPIEQLPQ